MPLWGVPIAETSIIWNVVGTLFLLPLITCLLTRGQFVVCQTAFAVCLGALVTPAIALYAMTDPPRWARAIPSRW